MGLNGYNMIIASGFLRLACGTALLTFSASPLFAQAADPADPSTSAPTLSGPTSGSDTNVIDDNKVFDFDITNGTMNLTDEQKLAASNECKQTIMTDPTRYSLAVKTFCQQLQ